ncbi:hypothetical protein B0H17DRAFT_1218928 [Mycena rosella]|uniref:DDE-1 domain-containing protein n=1 Tax=Mycena rosella TaxID=1033263 RepID=A0AAD7BKU0_MYCRO|nr:hypothetical protein B0H17DRAFT_1218928 [Mycena rosella]
MRQWVEGVLVPWRLKIIARDNLDDDQLMILFIDIYPVHTGQEFQTMIFEEFPFIILIFVPGGCTGLMQPADVGLQRVAKHILKQDSLDYLVDVFKTQCKQGVAPKDVKFPSSLPVLCDATVRGLVKMFNFFQTSEGRKIIKQAWRKCEILGTEWNLSIECSWGKASEKALLNFLREDPTLATEIANRCGATHLAQVLMSDPDPEENCADFDSPDDSDVSLNTVVHDALGIVAHADEFSQNAPTISAAVVSQETNGLAATNDSEDIWAYTENGERWDEVQEVQVDSDS